MKPRWLSLLAGTAAVLMAVETLFYLPVLASTASPLSFNRDVRPILSNHCFPCHGPDVQQRKAQRRLDTFDGAVALRDGIQGITPGKPAQSELWRRVTSSETGPGNDCRFGMARRGTPGRETRPTGSRRGLGGAL